MNKLTLSALIFIMAIPSLGLAEDLVKQGEQLTLERCIEIALAKHPSVVASANTLSVSESRVGQAEAKYYPQVNWMAGYRRISPGSSDQYSSSITLSQNIYDFGKTPAQVSVQKRNLESAGSDLQDVSDQIIFNVRQAYYGVLQAQRNREVAAETVRQFAQHLEQARGFYEAGSKPKFDVTRAEVDLSNARLGLIRSENALRTAMVNLSNAMGIPAAPEYTIEDSLSFQRYNITLEDATKRAYESRPDLRSANARKQAAEASVRLAKTGYYPELSGSASYNWEGEGFPLDHGWNIGATLSLPLFSGFLTRYQVEESGATLNVLSANEELLRQTILLEVQQAYLNLTEAEERIPASELVVKQAEENLDIANGRYTAGVGSPIEVTDAEVALSSAKTAYIQALYDYRIAQASLEKAMGAR
ncbi:MAG: TolC family protein [Nitrospirae bacterium]|nr:TolC family protein [Nitrospirota bacterium]